ncbi:ornithine cyclodeaminase family protein [Streptosporangium sp. NPDC000396]|uniref:ornithine cyclodeaminase family protein n=1 Tax=Streptosporangium sp. NPDC000396 TaxID=3366185 RepID=UPI00369175CC
MRLFSLEEITQAARPALVLTAVRDALIAHAEGRTAVPPPMHLEFPGADGDCHVKAGWISGASAFAVKIATGFYRNGARGLPANNGLICVVSAETGQITALLDDRGWLTAWRTAAAGALITHAMAPPEARTLGVFGTGLQARLQAQWLRLLRPIDEVLVSGRRTQETARLCGELGPSARPAPPDHTARVPIVITATAATAPLFPAAVVAPGAHVTGIGADMPHKNELPAGLFARAAAIAVDDHSQCLDHGDLGHAVRAGVVPETAGVAVGAILRDGFARRPGDITVADLTGVGAADAALAAEIQRILTPSSTA